MRCQCCGPHWGQLVMQRQAVGWRLPAALAEKVPFNSAPHQAASRSELVADAQHGGALLGPLATRSRSRGAAVPGGVSEPSQRAWGGVQMFTLVRPCPSLRR
eukprot:3607598-Rhodomonas_salina.1